jgi:3-deoxy-D-manno-octulosonate 8-phosphate phosphatase (KDO 8-P phosphatase)
MHSTTQPGSQPAPDRERAAAVRLLALDVDGTLTDGRINIGPDGEAMKSFSVRDGFGLALLREAGIVLAVITARRSTIVEHRARELRFDHVLQGVPDKASALVGLCRDHGLAPAQAGFVGDDWPDLPALLTAGFAAAPADAVAEVRARAHWVSQAPAGHGAIRELAEFILRARGEFDAALARRLGPAGTTAAGDRP